MTDRLWLVRHASTSWTGRRWCGRTDLALSPEGRAEAVALASRLAPSLPPDLEIRSSPLRRAVETAQAIASQIASQVGAAVEIDVELREVDFGDAEGMTWDELLANLPDVASQLLTPDSEIDWPNGERTAEVRRRAAAALELAAQGPGPCLMVTHGGLIRQLLAAAGIGAVPQVVLPARALALRRQAGGWEIDTQEVTS